VLVFFVDFEVFGKLVNPFGEDGDLNLGGAGVCLVDAVLFDYLGFLLFEHHGFSPFLLSPSVRRMGLVIPQTKQRGHFNSCPFILQSKQLSTHCITLKGKSKVFSFQGTAI
jgi:hypothetical protein